MKTLCTRLDRFIADRIAAVFPSTGRELMVVPQPELPIQPEDREVIYGLEVTETKGENGLGGILRILRVSFTITIKTTKRKK